VVDIALDDTDPRSRASAGSPQLTPPPPRGADP